MGYLFVRTPSQFHVLYQYHIAILGPQCRQKA